MKFCAKLVNDINFEPAALSPCCNTHAIKIPAFPYTGGPVDMEKYAEHIQNVANELQGRTDLCAGCPDLRSRDAAHAMVGILFHSVSINMHRFFCNCKCVYCSLWQHGEKGYGYDVLPGLKSLHEQKALAPNCFISWGGGEPGILPGFEESSDWALANGYFQYVHTNGIRYSPAMATLLKTGRGRINISLDSASANVYKTVKGVDAWHKVSGNIKRYAEEGHPSYIELKYIVFEKNNEIPEINSFLNFCLAHGISKVQVSLNFLETNANAVSPKTLLGAAFLMKQAQKSGIICNPFFIDDKWMVKIKQFADNF